ncbi:hypothetical protein D3C84_1315500 [compost metagenome]
MPVDGSRTRFATSGRISDLNVLDQVAGVAELGGYILAFDRRVVEVVEDTEGGRVDAFGDVDGF